MDKKQYAGTRVKRLFACGQWLELSDRIALTRHDLFNETHYEIVTRDGRWLLLKPEAVLAVEYAIADFPPGHDSQPLSASMINRLAAPSLRASSRRKNRWPVNPVDRIRMIAVAGRGYLVADATPIRGVDLDGEYVAFQAGQDISTRDGRCYPPSNHRIAIHVDAIQAVETEEESGLAGAFKSPSTSPTTGV